MSNLITGKDSLAGKLKGRPAWWFLGAVAAALVAILSVGTASAHIEHPGTYTGDVAASGDCGGGTVTVMTRADGGDIAEVSVTDLMVDGEAISGSATFDAGTVEIHHDGDSFTAYFDVEGHQVEVSGAFVDGGAGGLEGSVTVTPSTCGALAYSAVAGATVAPTALPSTGTGSSSSDSTGAPWALIASALALLGLGAGVVFLRRRTA
jgi:MYXO-CTERM domain-containing protein